VKAEWIVRDGRQDLLLFFNGWGMDRRTAAWIASAEPDASGHDLIVAYDYRDIALPEWLPAEMARYRSVHLVAWSLGVWAALHSGIEGIDRAVAVNGTPFPVDSKRGIPPGIFQGTLGQWSDLTRSRFERRMFAGREHDPRIEAVRSLRSSADQQEELRSIAAVVGAGDARPVSSWSFSKAVIGGRDLVFLPETQHAAWQGTDSVHIGDMPHFPFFHHAGWEELLA
jgi:pimeloyl-[acyl-carrier protein] methyl ester esterase